MPGKRPTRARRRRTSQSHPRRLLGTVSFTIAISTPFDDYHLGCHGRGMNCRFPNAHTGGVNTAPPGSNRELEPQYSGIRSRIRESSLRTKPSAVSALKISLRFVESRMA